MKAIRKIGLCAAVVVLFFAVSPGDIKREDKAYSLIKKLADTSGEGITNEEELGNAKIAMGFDPRYTGKIDLFYLDGYLGQEGYTWNEKIRNYVRITSPQ